MTGKQIVFRAMAVVASLLALYAILAMYTQAMLSGTLPEQVWRERVYLWWVDFLGAGWLGMLAVYLWRKSQPVPSIERSSSAALRVVLFPLSQVFLTGCLYFADYAWYVTNYSTSRGGWYTAIAVVFAAAAIATGWSARARRLA